MKNILILGSVTLDIAAYVTKLPKGNENYTPLKEEYRLSGNGYVIKKILDGFGIGNEWIAPIGTGVYGEQVERMLEEEGIDPQIHVDDVQGSSYHLIDTQQKQSVFVVPGGESTYDTSFLEYAGEEDYSAVVLTADYLSSQDADELIDQLSWMKCPIYFVPGGRLENLEEEIVEQAIEISTALYLTNEELQTLCPKTNSLEEGMKHLLQQTKKPVIVYSVEEGLLYLDEDETIQAPVEKISALDERRLQSFAAYLSALISGVDIRNALMFAMEFVQLLDRSHGTLDDYDWNEMKQKLVRMITWKS